MHKIVSFLGMESSVIKVTEATGKTVDHFMQQKNSSAASAGNSNDVTHGNTSCDLKVNNKLVKIGDGLSQAHHEATPSQSHYRQLATDDSQERAQTAALTQNHQIHDVEQIPATSIHTFNTAVSYRQDHLTPPDRLLLSGYTQQSNPSGSTDFYQF